MSNLQKNYQDLIVERKGSTMWLRLNRPDKRNAYSVAMVDSLKEVFSELKLSLIHI